MFLEQPFDLRGINDIDVFKSISWVISDIFQRTQVARVRQLVDVDDLVFRFLYQESHKIGANESGTAGDHNFQLGHSLFGMTSGGKDWFVSR